MKKVKVASACLGSQTFTLYVLFPLPTQWVGNWNWLFGQVNLAGEFSNLHNVIARLHLREIN